MQRIITPTSPQYNGCDKTVKQNKIKIKYKIGLFELFILLFVSFSGGFVANLLIIGYEDIIYPSSISETPRANFFKNIITSKESDLPQGVADAATNMVGVYIKKSNNAYLPTDSLGAAVILTTDGWLATPIDLSSKSESEIVAISSNREIIEAEKIIKDVYTGLFFIKVKSNNLEASRFAKADEVKTGESIWAISNSLYSELRISSAMLSNNNWHEDMIFSVNKNPYNYLVSSDLADDYLGAPLVNREGVIIGLYTSNNLAVPAYYIEDVLPMLIAKQEIIRIAVNLAYIDLEKNNFQCLNSDDSCPYLANKGALVEEVDSLETKLVKGDIIVNIDDNIINKNNNLTHLLQDHQPEDIVKMIIIRGGLEKEIDYKLR